MSPALPHLVCCSESMQQRLPHLPGCLLVRPLTALFYAPLLFRGRCAILKNSQDHIQQSFPQRVRINKNTSPQGLRGSLACQATLRSRSCSEGSIKVGERRGGWASTCSGSCQERDLHLVSVTLTGWEGIRVSRCAF